MSFANAVFFQCGVYDSYKTDVRNRRHRVYILLDKCSLNTKKQRFSASFYSSFSIKVCWLAMLLFVTRLHLSSIVYSMSERENWKCYTHIYLYISHVNIFRPLVKDVIMKECVKFIKRMCFSFSANFVLFLSFTELETMYNGAQFMSRIFRPATALFPEKSELSSKSHKVSLLFHNRSLIKI